MESLSQNSLTAEPIFLKKTAESIMAFLKRYLILFSLCTAFMIHSLKFRIGPASSRLRAEPGRKMIIRMNHVTLGTTGRDTPPFSFVRFRGMNWILSCV